MEILLFILVGVVLVILINFKNSVSEKLISLQKKIDFLSAELRTKSRDEQTERKKSIIEEITHQHKTPEIRPEVVKPKVEEKKVEEIKREEIKQEPVPVLREIKPTAIPVNKPPVTPKPGFFERNPD